jgi:hypothetical protein
VSPHGKPFHTKVGGGGLAMTMNYFRAVGQQLGMTIALRLKYPVYTIEEIMTTPPKANKIRWIAADGSVKRTFPPAIMEITSDPRIVSLNVGILAVIHLAPGEALIEESLT